MVEYDYKIGLKKTVISFIIGLLVVLIGFLSGIQMDQKYALFVPIGSSLLTAIVNYLKITYNIDM